MESDWTGVGGGVILASLMVTEKRSGSTRRLDRYDRSQTSEPNNRGVSAWEGIKGALVGVATSHLTDLGEAFIPGFKEHFQKSQTQALKLRG